MIKHSSHDMNAAGPDSPNNRRDNALNPDLNQPIGRPYSDVDNLYEIPRVRPDDPPMRRWWIDDEPQYDGSDSRK